MAYNKESSKAWRHNSFFGHAKMMQSQCDSIIASSTTSPAAKATAAEIRALAWRLSAELKERIDAH